MRYYTQFGAEPNITACVTVAGPQDESQILEEVKRLLDRPGIEEVAVVFDHGLGKRIETFRKIQEDLR